MSFVYPQFLWAFFVLLIPIIVHLFNFRRYKTVYFSRVKHLQEVIEDSKSGAKLKHLLVLFTRLLLLSALVLAFAQPYIPSEEGTATENITSIYLDNTYSMQAEGSDGDLLNEIKNQAIAVVQSLDENERINLLTADLLSIHQRYYSKSEIIDMIKGLDYSSRSTKIDQVLRMQADLLANTEEKGNQRIFLFSDFQKSTTNLEEITLEEIPTYYYQATPENSANIYIDSIWFLTPVHRTETPVELNFRVRNTGTEDANEISVRLAISGNEPAPKLISIPAGSYVDETITFTDRTPGKKEGTLQVETSQLFFDDSFYFTYDIKEEVNVLIIKSTADVPNNLTQLYGLEEYYNATAATISNVVPQDFENKELIILQNVNKIPSGIKELLDQTLESGGTVVLIPGDEVEPSSWNTYLGELSLPSIGRMDTSNVELSYFNDNDPLYTGVFEEKPSNYAYPKLFSKYILNTNSSQRYTTLFGSSNKTPFMLYAKNGNGRVFFLSAPLEAKYTNFQNHALFAATFLRIAETANFQTPLYMTLGDLENFPIQTEIAEQYPIHLINEALMVDVIPLIVPQSGTNTISFSHLEDQLKEAGFYQLTDTQAFDELIALNYNRQESDVALLSDEAIVSGFQSIGWNGVKSLALSSEGAVQINQLKATEYWRILLILALIFLAIEILLLKLWKR